MKKKEPKRLEESTLKQTYRVETYIVPAVDSPTLRIDNEIDERIANRLKITNKHLSENDTANEKEMPFILHNVEFVKFSDKNNKSIDKDITEKRTCETTLSGTLMSEGDEHYGREGLIENLYDCNKTRDVAQNLKFEATQNQQFSIGSQDTLYPSRQFRKANSLLMNIDERSEYSANNEWQSKYFCQHGYRNGCTATFVPPEEISSGIFKRNCLEKIEILQQWETEVTEREINVRKKEKEVFMMQKELRIAARVLNEKLKQVDQYLRCKKSMRVVDRKLVEVAQVPLGELHDEKHNELLKVPKEHQYQSMDSDEYERSRVHQVSNEYLYRADEPCEFCGVNNTFDEIKRFNEHIELNEARRFNEVKESNGFATSDKVNKSCAHKISDKHPYQVSEKSDEFKSGENLGEIEKCDEIKTLNEFVKRDEVRRFDEINESDEFEKVDCKLKKFPDDDLRTNNESAKTRGRWRNSQSLARDTREEKGPDIKARRSGVHSSHSRQSRLPTAYSKIRAYSSLRYKERPKISYDDLNSTLSADPGDSSLVRTSEQFHPHVYKRPNAFMRSASVRGDAGRKGNASIVSQPQETIDVEGRPDCDIEEERVLRRFSENIQASRDKSTKFQHYGLVGHTPRDTRTTAECNSHNSHRRVFSYLNLEVDKHTRCKSNSDFSTTRPSSCNIEMDEWLQKKRLAYTLAVKTKPSDDKENLECNTVTGRGKSSKKKKKILTIFGV